MCVIALLAFLAWLLTTIRRKILIIKILTHHDYTCLWSWSINEKRSAWTCWVSGVKFNHGSTSSRWRSYDRTNSLRTPTMKESQLLREKTTSSFFVSTCSNPVHAQFHWIAYTRNTRHVTSFACNCSRNTSDRSLAWSHHRRRSIYAGDRSRSTWNMKHFRQTARGCLLHQ